MKMAFVAIVIILLIWEYFFLPKYVEKNIIKELEKIDAKIADIELLSRRECIYNVGYLKEDRLVRDNIKYNLFGQIKWI